MKPSVIGCVGAVLAATATVPASIAFGASPKYYFQIQEVKAGPDVDAALKAYAADALKAELASRPEWASDIGQGARPGEDRSALVAELKKRNLRGFDVTVRFDDFKQELKDPKPGGKLKQLAVNVKLSVFGTTIPEAKVAFGGAGEAGVEAEVSERRMAADKDSAGRDVIKDAIKQAVDQAVLKLAGPKSQPLTERRKKK